MILVAPDSFKGTFSAPRVAEAIARGIASAGATARTCPVADGGDGTLEVVLAATSGRTRQVAAHDALGRAIEAPIGWLDGATALVEMAAASGLGLVSPAERDAEAASTRGTGELIAAAVAGGARTVVVTMGGSATTDGGVGAIEAIAAAGGLGGARLVALCDVTTPFERAATVFAPQKGADEDAVRRLAARLDAVAASLPADPRGVAMTGAAGGLAGGLWAACGAHMVPGAQWVLDAVGFDGLLTGAGAVVVGEGRLDGQTLEGKVIGEVVARARRAGVPVHAIVGRVALGRAALASLALASVTEATTLPELEDAGRELALRLAARAAETSPPARTVPPICAI